MEIAASSWNCFVCSKMWELTSSVMDTQIFGYFLIKTGILYERLDISAGSMVHATDLLLVHHNSGDELPTDFVFISHYHSVASIYIEMEWICSNEPERLTPEQIARKITEVRKISMSDKYFGIGNLIYEFQEQA